MDERDQGCLAGLLEIIALAWLFDWLQDHFGFGRGCSISGCGCGFLLLCVFLTLLCGIVFNTDWFRFGF
ncbi:MAG: hypothetical protein RMN24_12230 [Anaerolineae bacterium]|nr:hypothetical protein [Caldilineales bacterium]MCX7851730.1 hypothetical protein [Caldilineales bacterium]MDW8269922.1 hypothetical protein [Anaerolineae bacterium]